MNFKFWWHEKTLLASQKDFTTFILSTPLALWWNYRYIPYYFHFNGDPQIPVCVCVRVFLSIWNFLLQIICVNGIGEQKKTHTCWLLPNRCNLLAIDSNSSLVVLLSLLLVLDDRNQTFSHGKKSNRNGLIIHLEWFAFAENRQKKEKENDYFHSQKIIQLEIWSF